MRANLSNIPSGYNSPLKHYKKTILLIILVLVVAILILPVDHLRGNLPFLPQSQELNGNVDVSVPLYEENNDEVKVNPRESESRVNRLEKECSNIFSGKWVPYPQGPLYTNKSGCLIDDGENCLKFGRPDTEFMKWRWKPDGCELPVFDAAQFLEIVRGKSMAFVGDSVARNQAQSLLCLLTSVSYPLTPNLLVGDSVARNQAQSLLCLLTSVARPVDESGTNDTTFRRWVYTDYNFTLELLLTTHLVKAHGVDAFSMNPIDLYLDEADETWATKVENLDYVIISTGHWFSRPIMYHEKYKDVGCNMCSKKNMTDLTRYYGFRKAFQTAFRTFLDLQNFKGIIFLRTITPTHFETEEWEGRGNCVRKRPFTKQEMKFDWYLSMFYKIQMDEFWAAKREGKERGLKFRLLDITETMRLRPDGHPNHYGHPPKKKKRSADCLHWCLPGPIDTWNELLLQMLKTEGVEGSIDGKFLQ
ncbi:protein trichome birefringence-like 19 [Camellia sinensis]|uniref:protein trichome birefringence-like 19 n=1 Tax=Camellia sinensis TaxID=4442 RepID=UPI001035759A|nr:protein trichome birefringence-like 19 [Camellia sinensis]